MDDAKKLELESIKQNIILEQKTLEEPDKENKNLIEDNDELDKEILDTREERDKIAEALTEIAFKLSSTISPATSSSSESQGSSPALAAEGIKLPGMCLCSMAQMKNGCPFPT